ncbi:MAG: thiol reductant ABC exporter subunit CydD [Wenzhouxiangella sp.]|nr:thiol reductant ABC exporter subunit CydD [Wenzhouxiangella sp.]TVR95854.1 MAG: thiol reductant ABC exporter subunit CydD [Wenzhouxiangellaceae bacterium]
MNAATPPIALLEALAILSQAGLMAWLVHAAIIDSKAFSELGPALLALLAAVVLRATVLGARGMLSARASSAIRNQLRLDLYRRLAAAGPQAGQDSGHLLSRLVEQVEALDPYYARYRPQAHTALIVPLLIVIAVFYVDWLAGLLLALTAPLIPLFMVLVGWGAERESLRQQQALGRLAGLFHDRLRGLAQLRRLGAATSELARLSERAEAFRERTFRVLKLAFLSSAVLEFFAAVAIAALAIYIGLGLLGFIDFGPAPALTLASGLFILLLAPEFFNPLRQLAQHWHDRADALAAATDLAPLLALPPARPEPAEVKEGLPTSACAVEVRQLAFAWPGRDRLFQELDLRASAGERLLIQGPSGGGKSSLLRLLAGFVAPTNGCITYDDIDLSQLNQAALAQCRAWLGQHPVLFPGSLRDNLLLARPTADAAEIERACRLAGVSEFLAKLTDGLDTRLGEQGLGLSSGQAQRLALARALLSPRPILFLDEPTASLDPANEQRFWQALSAAGEDRAMTVMCASHAPAARRWADRVLILDQGKLFEAAC